MSSNNACNNNSKQKRLLAELNQRTQSEFSHADELKNHFEEQQAKREDLEAELAELVEVRSSQRQQLQQLQNQYNQLAKNAPAWHTAQSALTRLKSSVAKHLKQAKRCCNLCKICWQKSVKQRLLVMRWHAKNSN